MRLVFMVTLLASAAFPQSLLNPARAARFTRYLQPGQGERQLKCEVTPIPPQLNFSFRFQTGYIFRLPMRQFSGSGHLWGVVSRVTPANGQPPYFLGEQRRLPPIPAKTKVTAELGGAFWVGEGDYKVEWVLFDEQGRVCRKQWKIAAKLTGSEHAITPGVAPYTVAQVSFRRWSAQDASAADAAPLHRLTVFLHAAPLYPRSTRLRAQDRLTLLGSLASLLESVPAQTVRLVIFNLDQQKELYRTDAFTPETFDQAAQSLTTLQLQLVDYSVLKNRRGHIDLLENLLKQELRAPDPPDAAIVIGPATRYFDKVPQADFEQPSGNSPLFFYLAYKPYMRQRAEPPDSIQQALKRVHGKKLDIRTPDDFARAIKQVEAQLIARK
ncbi:MAG TPA: hypothetical protein VKX49_26510 [Bryobacteraceae bacterium]|nr:hypothetical protein [Bryobacteraceae bacterium]